MWLLYDFVYLGDSLAYQVPIASTDIYKCSFPSEPVYADVILMMGKLFNCEVLIDILCLDCGLLNVRVKLVLPHHMRVCI